MEEIMSLFSVSIISALIASLLAYIIIRLWKHSFIPWYEERVYKDVNISGEWQTELHRADEDVTYRELATIDQKAHRVAGKISLLEDSRYKYEFDGEFKNLILTARYWFKDKSSRDIGTFTLELKNDGSFEGYYSGFSSRDNKVVSGTYNWTKIIN